MRELVFLGNFGKFFVTTFCQPADTSSILQPLKALETGKILPKHK